MHRKNELLWKSIILLLLIVMIMGGGYIFSYFKYNDYDLTELEMLKVQNRLLQEEIESVDNLKQIKGEYLIGKVIIRDIHEFYNEVVVNLGSDDGVLVGNAVLNSDGLVGVVSEVERNKAYVKLLSGNYNVSVRINETYGNLNSGKITLLDKYTELNIGDEVYTSGYGDVEGNIYVGKIEEIGKDNEDLGQVATVKLVDNLNLNYVAIMINN